MATSQSFQPENALSYYGNQIKKIPVMSNTETIERILRFRAGDTHEKNKIILGHTRLVISLALHRSRHSFSRQPHMAQDLISEGHFGLIRAIEMFNPDFGYKFSTYATFWIRDSMDRFTYANRTSIHVPVYMQKNMASRAKHSIDDPSLKEQQAMNATYTQSHLSVDDAQFIQENATQHDDVENRCHAMRVAELLYPIWIKIPDNDRHIFFFYLTNGVLFERMTLDALTEMVGEQSRESTRKIYKRAAQRFYSALNYENIDKHDCCSGFSYLLRYYFQRHEPFYRAWLDQRCRPDGVAFDDIEENVMIDFVD